MNHARQEPLNVFDKRRHERTNLAYEQIPGKFHIGVGGNRIEFNQVNDVSISGMGILLDSYLATNSNITIGYEADEFCVQIQAEVVWQEKLSDEVYRMGVHFSNHNVENNVMLFMTLREYIDDFGAIQ